MTPNTIGSWASAAGADTNAAATVASRMRLFILISHCLRRRDLPAALVEPHRPSLLFAEPLSRAASSRPRAAGPDVRLGCVQVATAGRACRGTPRRYLEH